MASLLVKASTSRSNSRSASPNRKNNNASTSSDMPKSPRSPAFLQQQSSAENKARHKSPAQIRRLLDSTDDSYSSFATDYEEFMSNVQPPADDEDGYCNDSGQQSLLSNGSTDLVDDGDSSAARARRAIEQVHNKIIKTRELIRAEQAQRDEHVNEYLNLSANAEKQQLSRLKANFEKKNQKSANTISQLQKKLDTYSKKLKHYELHGAQITHRQPREVLRDMGQGLRNVGGNIMSKPRVFAHLIKNKFGSADNINSLSHNSTFYVNYPSRVGNEDEKIQRTSSTLPGLKTTHSAAALKFPSEEGSDCSSLTSEIGQGIKITAKSSLNCHSPGRPCSIKSIISDLQEQRETLERFKEKLDSFKDMKAEISHIRTQFQEERSKGEKLESEFRSFKKLQEREVQDLKQTMTDMNEKVKFQSEDRVRDIHNMLETCQTKIWEMEHQQTHHYDVLEGLDNSNARILVVKLINVFLTILQLILLLLATCARFMTPLFKTRGRIATATVVSLTLFVILKKWPEFYDISSYLKKRLNKTTDSVNLDS